MKKFLLIVLAILIIFISGYYAFRRAVPIGSRLVSPERARILDCFESENGWRTDPRSMGVSSKICDEQDLSEVIIYKRG